MKVCPNCNGFADDTANVCPNCGTPFAPVNPQQPNYTQPQQPNYAQQPQQPNYAQQPQQPNYAQQPQQPNYAQQPQQGYNYGAQPPAPEQKKKGIKAWQIILIVLGVILLLIILIAVIGSRGKSNSNSGSSSNYSYNDSYNSSDSGKEAPTQKKNVSYTKGTLDGVFYTNEWAGFEYQIPTGWKEAPKEKYADFEGDGVTECGLYLLDNAEERQFVICYERLSGKNGILTESSYIDIFKKNLTAAYEKKNISCTFSEYTDFTIAGKTFKKATATLNGGPITQQVYVCKYDGYMIDILVTSDIEEQADIMVSNISAID